MQTICCCLIGVVVFAVSPGIAEADILAHWRFDESGGGTAFDSAGTANGTLNGGAGFVPNEGIAGGAISLSQASNSFVNVGDHFMFSSTDAFSIQVWVRVMPNVVTNIFPVARHLAGTVNGYMIAINPSGTYGTPNRPWFYTSDVPGQEARSTTNVNDDAWHQIVAVYEPGVAARIYVDGGAAEDMVSPGGITANSVPFLIGGLVFGSTPTGVFTGLIDDVQIYCDALTDEQVQFLFDNPGQEIPRCPANWNRDCGVNSQDFFDFLADLFEGDADFNQSGSTDSQDFFDFVTAFFTPC